MFPFTGAAAAFALLLLLPSTCLVAARLKADVGEEGCPTSSSSGRERELSEMASFLKGNNGDIPVASNLAVLLRNHGITTSALVGMIERTKDPIVFADMFAEADSWKAKVVTPVQQGVNGQLVQAVLFSNEASNPENPQRVLSFAGVQFREGSYKEILPDGACLEASYGFKETQAEGTWQMSCMQSGYKVPNMIEWATQVGALVESTNPTFLTGFKQGCEIAKSEGLLRPNLPVVCWGATGTLTEAWIDAYPGLAKAIGKDNTDNENGTYDSVFDPIAVNNDDYNSNEETETNTTVAVMNVNSNVVTSVIDPIAENGNTASERATAGAESSSSATTYRPQNPNIYVIQTFTDPSSNCLLPPEAPGTGLANVCAYSAGSRCDANNGTPRFDYSLFSRCSDMSSLPILLQSNLPVDFDETSCISRNQVGTDHHLRDCPFEEIYTAPQKSPSSWGTEETVYSDSEAATDVWSWRISAVVSLFATTIYLLQ